MALESRFIPVLEGKVAEDFVKRAEENEKQIKKSVPKYLTLEQFKQIEKNSK